MSTQVAIAVFYDTVSKVYIRNAITIIQSNLFIKGPQEEETMFYILHTHIVVDADQNASTVTTIVPYTYKGTRARGFVLLGLVHLGSTTKNAVLLGNRLVGSAAAQPTGDQPDHAMNTWVIDTALDHVASDHDRTVVHDRIHSLKEYFESKVVDGAAVAPASFYSA